METPTVLVFHDVASLMDSFFGPRATDPHSPVPTPPDQGFAPTAGPAPQAGINGSYPAGLNGSYPAGLNGAPHNGVNGRHSAGLNGAGLATAGPAAPDYAPPPPPVPQPQPPAPVAATAPAQPHAPDYAPSEVTAQPQAPDYARQVPTAVPVGAVSDEERTSYGLLLDRAAERGLLDPSEYEVRLRRLAEATTTAEMVAIVSELPAFIPPPTPADHRSRSDIQSASRTTAGDGQRRRLIIWVLMGVLVVLALVSLIILALSVGRLSRSRSSMPPPPPAAARPVSALRL